MKGEITNTIKVACIYMTTIIGAGFASGQEIVQFFSSYHEEGFYGIILAGSLFSLIGCIVLDKVYNDRIKDYNEFLFPLVGYAAGRIMEIIITLFMLTVFFVMIAGLISIETDKLGIQYIYGAVVTVAICLFFILKGIRGVVALSVKVMPVLIISIISVGLYIVFNDLPVFSTMRFAEKVTRNWVFSALTYVSYNSLMSTVVMCSLLPYLKTRRVGVAGGILGGFMLCLIAFVLNSAIYIFYPGPLIKELPISSIMGKYDGTASGLYSIVLWLAMIMSAITAGYCFVHRVCSRIHISFRLLAILVCITAIPFSYLGFSNLIACLYPIFGYAGLFITFAVLFQGVGIFLPKKIKIK